MGMTGAGMIVRALDPEGVEYAFGIPGGTVISPYYSFCNFVHVYFAINTWEF